MVEETTAASRMLADQTEELFGLVSRFKVSQSAGSFAAPAAQPAVETYEAEAPPPPRARAAPAARSVGNTALADDDWTEF
jgi:methyl-accepting chemotaxis protein